jgi:hypothetical protein
MSYRFLSALIVLIIFSSCQKEIHFPYVEPPASSQINIQYNPLSSTSTKFELVITDSANKVLYDDELDVNKSHSITVAAKQYNLTTIEFDDAEKKYKSKTYMKVQGTNWVIRPIDDKQNIGSSNITGGSDAKLVCDNVPSFTGFMFYSGSQYQPGSSVSVTPIPAQNRVAIKTSLDGEKAIPREEIAKMAAAINKPGFRPYLSETHPAIKQPAIAPKARLPVANPSQYAFSSNCFCRNGNAPEITAKSNPNK